MLLQPIGERIYVAGRGGWLLPAYEGKGQRKEPIVRLKQLRSHSRLYHTMLFPVDAWRTAASPVR